MVQKVFPKHKNQPEHQFPDFFSQTPKYKPLGYWCNSQLLLVTGLSEVFW